jgi:23S rRNA (adenine2503-C2)-methyltransferase
MSLDLPHISEMMKALPKPKGRKITLNFAVADWVINAKRLARLFNPTYFMVKLTPMHRTVEAVKHGIETLGDSTSSYPYEEHEYNLKQEGFDVLVFLASDVEDKSRTALCTSHRLVC